MVVAEQQPAAELSGVDNQSKPDIRVDKRFAVPASTEVLLNPIELTDHRLAHPPDSRNTMHEDGVSKHGIGWPGERKHAIRRSHTGRLSLRLSGIGHGKNDSPLEVEAGSMPADY